MCLCILRKILQDNTSNRNRVHKRMFRMPYEHIFIEVCFCTMSHDLRLSCVVYVAEQESLLGEFFCCTKLPHEQCWMFAVYFSSTKVYNSVHSYHIKQVKKKCSKHYFFIPKKNGSDRAFECLSYTLEWSPLYMSYV